MPARFPGHHVSVACGKHGVSLSALLPPGIGPHRTCLPVGGSSWGAGKSRCTVHFAKSKNEGCAPLPGTHPRIDITGISERADGRKRKISHSPTPYERPWQLGEHFSFLLSRIHRVERKPGTCPLGLSQRLQFTRNVSHYPRPTASPTVRRGRLVAHGVIVRTRQPMAAFLSVTARTAGKPPEAKHLFASVNTACPWDKT